MLSAERKSEKSASGRYLVEDVVAEGGMGTIHRAFDQLASTYVAYKRFRLGVESQRARLTALFQREFDQLAQLNHPCIVKAYDFGFDELGPYYTMELLSGADLARSRRLPVHEAARVLRDVASAVALLHARRLVHRDICPNNVRLTEAGVAKLIDFGALTPFGDSELVVGTPPFLAPENLRGEPLDQRTDLFSLGALAYWLLTRKLPFPARHIEDLTLAWQQPLAPPSDYMPDVPQELDELVLSLVALDPAARPPSASHVMEQLTRIASLPRELNEPEVIASYLHHPPLQGRTDACERIAAELDALANGRGGVLKIEGAPGVGRSALLAHLATSAQLRGLTVLRAHASLAPGTFGVAKELARLGLGMFPDLAREHATILATASDEPGALSAIETIERHAQLALATSDVLFAVSQCNRVVLIVDDMHLCDASSLALLSSMCEELVRRPILLAFSSLPDEREGDLVKRPLDGAARELSLQPLSAADVAALIKTSFGELPSSQAFADVLFQRTGGNPGHCMDVVRGALANGLLRYAGGVFALPRAIEARDLPDVGVQRFRLDTNDDDAMALVELLAVSGRALTTEQLCAACELPAPTVLETLARLERRRVVLHQAEHVALATSELAGELERGISLARKRELHVRLAALSAGDLHAEVEAGFHLMRAGEAEELRGARRVATAVANHPYEASAERSFVPALESALEVLGRHGCDDHDCVQLLVPLSIAGFYTSYPLQRRYLERAMHALAARTGITVALRLRRWLGARLALWVGLLVASCKGWRRTDGRSLRRDLEAYLGVLASGVAAAANSNDSAEARRLEHWLTPLSGAASSAVRAVYAFCRAGSDVAQGYCLRAIERYQALHVALSVPITGMDERFREQIRLGALYGLAHLHSEREPATALRYAEQLEQASTFFAPHAVGVRMGCAMYFGDTPKAAALQARAEVLALRPGLIWSAFTGLMLRFIHGMAMIDDVVAVARNLEENRSLADISPEASLYVELARAHVLTLRGRPSEAAEVLRELVPRARDRNLSLRLLMAVGLSRALRESSQPREALNVCEQHEALMPNQAREHPILTDLLLQQRALSRAAIGDTRVAAEQLEQRIAEREPNATPLVLGSLHRDRASVALLEHDQVAFDRHAGKMLDYFRLTGTPHLLQQHDLLLARAARRPDTYPLDDDASSVEVDTVYRSLPRRPA